MTNDELDSATVVPLSNETEAERMRIRRSNDRDQQLEREGKPSAHNQGYDEVADFSAGAPEGPAERQVAKSTVAGADINADWQSASNAGDETPGGDNPTPDENVVDEIGRAVGLEYQDDEPLRGVEKVDARDRGRHHQN
jgi:hypothetical protein